MSFKFYLNLCKFKNAKRIVPFSVLNIVDTFRNRDQASGIFRPTEKHFLGVKKIKTLKSENFKKF